MGTGYLGTNYTQDQINTVPLLADAVSQVLNANFGSESGPSMGRILSVNQAKNLINSGMTNPVSFVESQLPKQVENYVLSQTYGQGQAQVPLSSIESATEYLTSNGVSADQINAQIKTGETNAQDYVSQQNTINQESGGGGGGFFGSLIDALSNPKVVLELAAAYAIPGAAEALAPSIAAALSVSTATATAIAAGSLSAATQVAAGVPVENAIKNAAVNTIVSTGANEAATAMTSTGNNPAAVNALTSAAAGAAKTIAAGGSASQALQNAAAGGAASAAGTVTQNLGGSATLGNTIAGAVGGAAQSGGNTLSALTGAASGLGQNVIPPNSVAVTLKDGTTGYLTNTGVVYNQDGSINQGASVNKTVTNAAGTQVASNNINISGFTLSDVNTPAQLASAGITLPSGYSLGNSDSSNSVLVNLPSGQTAWLVQTDPNATQLPPASVSLETPANPVGVGVNLSDLDTKSQQGLSALLNPGSGGGGSTPSANFSFLGTVNGSGIFESNGKQFALLTVNGSPALQDATGTVYYLTPDVQTQLTQIQTQATQQAELNNDPLPSITSKVVSSAPPANITTKTSSDTSGSTTGGGGGGGDTISSGGSVTNLNIGGTSGTGSTTGSSTLGNALGTNLNNTSITGTGTTTSSGTGTTTGTGTTATTGTTTGTGTSTGTVTGQGTGTSQGTGGIGTGTGGGTGSGKGTGTGTGTGTGVGSGTGQGKGSGQGTEEGTGAGGGSIGAYDPNLYIYGNVVKALGAGLGSLPSAQSISGQTQGLGGGAAGDVSVESQSPQKNVWNSQSLRLQPGAEASDKDYGNLYTALGI